MASVSKISWTKSTYNPWWGCTAVSAECDFCYAESFSNRLGNNLWGKDAPRKFFGDKHWNDPVRWNKQAAKTCEFWPVFCGSMCDILEDRRDLDEPRARLRELVYDTPYLTWLLLSKRPQNFEWMSRAADALPVADSWLPQNVWKMTTVGVKKSLWRVDALLDGPMARVYGISAEPLLEQIDLPQKFLDLNGFGWVIIGGESGLRPRPMKLVWAERLIDQCLEAGVQVFVKQLGGTLLDKRDDPAKWPEKFRVQQMPFGLEVREAA